MHQRSHVPDSKYGSSLIVFKRADGAKLQPSDSKRIGAAVKQLNGAHVDHGVGVKDRQAARLAEGATRSSPPSSSTGPTSTKRPGDAAVELRAETEKALVGSGLTAGQTGEAAVQHDFHEGISEPETVVSIATVILDRAAHGDHQPVVPGMLSRTSGGWCGRARSRRLGLRHGRARAAGPP